MNKLIEGILRGTKIMDNADSDPELKAIHRLKPKLVATYPNKKLNHGSIDWEIITIIYSIYKAIAVEHYRILRALEHCNVSQDNLQSFNADIDLMDRFISNCTSLFELNDSNNEYLPIFDFFNANNGILPTFKKIVMVYDSHNKSTILDRADIRDYGYDRLRTLFALFGFDTQDNYNVMNESNDEQYDSIRLWYSKFNKDVPLDVQARRELTEESTQAISSDDMDRLQRSIQQRQAVPQRRQPIIQQPQYQTQTAWQ